MKISSLLMLAAACVSAPAAPGKTEAAPKGPPTADEVTAFLDKTNTDLRTYGIKSNTASWIQNTYITDDTDRDS